MNSSTDMTDSRDVVVIISGPAIIGGLAFWDRPGRNPRGHAATASVTTLSLRLEFDHAFAPVTTRAIKLFLAMVPLIFLATRGRSAYE